MKRQQSLPATDTVVLDVGYKNVRTKTAVFVTELERSFTERRLDLPSLPEVALKIRKALADENVSVSEVVRLLGADPALAARIIRTANSALFYRGSKPITSLSGAVSQLGHKMVRNVSLSFAAQQVFIGYGSRDVRDLVSAIWRHSVHTAVLAHMLARIRSTINPDDAFLAGLLHEVGKLYILMRAKDDVDSLVGEAAFAAVVTEWHPRVGRALIESWQLADELAAAIGDHEIVGLDSPDPPTLTSIVAVANYLAGQSAVACDDPEFFAKAPGFGGLSVDKPTFDWLIRAADVDVRLLALAFGV